MRRLLIAGFGDVASRMIPLLRGRYRVYGLARSAERAAQMRALGVVPVQGDLDDPDTLRRLGGLSQDLLHLAPPPTQGNDDPRTANLLRTLMGRGTLPQGPRVSALRARNLRAATARLRAGSQPRRHASRAPGSDRSMRGNASARSTLPPRLVYVSTSGVYGDRRGALVRETDTVTPETDRAVRRVAAERRLRAFGRDSGTRIPVLRVPGIYAHDRLPLERLRRGTPSLRPEDDSYTNHIHADDLARLVLLTLHRGRAGRVYHAADGQWMKAGDYFDAVADAFALPRPERVTSAQAAARIPANALSFLRESRRLDNRRAVGELGMRFRYPTVAHTLAHARAVNGGQRSDTQNP